MSQLPVSSSELAAVFINDSTNLVIVGQEVNYEYRYQAMNTLISVVNIVSEVRIKTVHVHNTVGCHGDCTAPIRLDATNRC